MCWTFGNLPSHTDTHRDNSDKSTVNLTVIIDEALDKYENKKKIIRSCNNGKNRS